MGTFFIPLSNGEDPIREWEPTIFLFSQIGREIREKRVF